VRAVDAVVKGLGRVKAEGGNVMQTMDELGIKGTEETGVILRLAGAGELLADSLRLGDSAWRSNSALAEEAAKRYETTESKVKIAWNNIQDAAIAAGAVLLPLIAGVAESVSGIAQAFGNLPEPVKGAVTVLGGVAGVAALGAGAFLTLTPRILDAMNAFQTLNTRADGTSRNLGKVGKAAGAAGAGLVGFQVVVSALNSMQGETATVQEFTSALVGLGKQSDSLDNMFGKIGLKEFNGDIKNSGEALKKLVVQDFNSSAGSFADTVLGFDNGMAKLRKGFENTDKALASTASSGNLKLASDGFKAVATSSMEVGVSLEDVGKRFPTYIDALRETAAQQGHNYDTATLLKWAMGEVPPEMEKTAKSAENAAAGLVEMTGAGGEAYTVAEDVAKALEEIGINAEGTVTDLVKFTDALVNAGLLQLSARDAARGFEEAIDAMSESLANNGRTLDTTTEKGRANEAALDGIAGAGYRSAQAMAANGASQDALAGNLDTTFNKLVAAARQFTNTDAEAQALARDIMKIPPGVDIKTWMADEAKRMAEATKGAVDAIPARKDISVVTTYTEVDLRRDEARENGPRQPRATGGRVPGFSEGGRLPGNGPGTEVTDGFLGVSALGAPLVRVDAAEWIINRNSSDRYNRELAAINAGTFPKLPGYADGGRAGREWSAQQLGYVAPRATAEPSGTVVNADFTLNQVNDPVTAAHEVTRRLNRLGT
jgi:hypothetical protein